MLRHSEILHLDFETTFSETVKVLVSARSFNTKVPSSGENFSLFLERLNSLIQLIAYGATTPPTGFVELRFAHSILSILLLLHFLLLVIYYPSLLSSSFRSWFPISVSRFVFLCLCLILPLFIFLTYLLCPSPYNSLFLPTSYFFWFLLRFMMQRRKLLFSLDCASSWVPVWAN